ncbi:MAG: hypothetical protein K6F53_00015 [Lachnospiraceae bacterium]|nr:hypothetical protein [Lachnospiraceae bacterium]
MTIRALTDDLGQPKGSCCGEVTEEYRITGNRYTDLSKAKIKINSDAKGKTRACTYTGSAIEPGGAGQPELVITTGKGRNLRVLTPKTEYTEGDYEILGYYNNIGKGNSAVILLRGLGDFRGVRAVKFSISASPVDAGWSGVFR